MASVSGILGVLSALGVSAAVPHVLPAFRAGGKLEIVIDDEPSRVRCAQPTITSVDDESYTVFCPLDGPASRRSAEWAARAVVIHSPDGEVCRRSVERVVAVGRMYVNSEECETDPKESGSPAFLAREARWLVAAEVDGTGCGETDPDGEHYSDALFATWGDAETEILRSTEGPEPLAALAEAAFRKRPEFRRIDRRYRAFLRSNERADPEAPVDWTRFNEGDGVLVTPFGAPGRPPRYLWTRAATAFTHSDFEAALAVIFEVPPRGDLVPWPPGNRPDLDSTAFVGGNTPFVEALVPGDGRRGPIIVFDSGVLWSDRGRWRLIDHDSNVCGMGD